MAVLQSADPAGLSFLLYAWLRVALYVFIPDPRLNKQQLPRETGNSSCDDGSIRR